MNDKSKDSPWNFLGACNFKNANCVEQNKELSRIEQKKIFGLPAGAPYLGQKK